MSRLVLPPTPGSSTNIKGQDGTAKLDSLCSTFELLPPALHDPIRFNPTDSSKLSPPSSPPSSYPGQVAETVKARRRRSTATSAAAPSQNNRVDLPPAPTRSRRIIHMKLPKGAAIESSGAMASKGKNTANNGKGGGSLEANGTGANTTSTSTGQQEGKKKQSGSKGAAGKVARRTAHSLIERRRRGRMNDEFAKLKGMIPACTGDMHKLSILQACIDYIQYLEDCVGRLQAHHEDGPNQIKLPSIREFHPTFRDPDADVEMTDSEDVSPVLLAQDARGRQQSYSSVSTDPRRHSYIASATTSPALGPQISHAPSSAGSTVTSPLLNPQVDVDHEVTAALLMLNKSGRKGFTPVNDRRDSTLGSGRKGLWLQDLVNP